MSTCWLAYSAQRRMCIAFAFGDDKIMFDDYGFDSSCRSYLTINGTIPAIPLENQPASQAIRSDQE